MEKLPLFDQRSMTPSRSSTTPSAAEAIPREMLSTMLHKALSTCQGTVTPAHLGALLEYLGSISPAMAQRLLTLPDGIQSRSRFIPSIADFVALKAELEARAAEYRPAPTSYKRLAADPEIVQPPAEDRKRQVKDALGYDPMVKRGGDRETGTVFKPRPIEEIVAEGKAGGPPSAELLASMRGRI